MLEFTLGITLLVIGFTCGYLYVTNTRSIPGAVKRWDIVSRDGRHVGVVQSMTVDEVCLFCNRYYGKIYKVQEDVKDGMVVVDII